MKRVMSVLIALVLLLTVSPLPVSGEMSPLPATLWDWITEFQASYISSDPVKLKPIIPVAGWYVYAGGDWTCQYPPGWSVLSGDAVSFLACDARQLACYDYVQLQSFLLPLSHDQVGAYAFNRVAGDLPFRVEGTFQKNTLPQLMLTPPSGISQTWFVRWLNPSLSRCTILPPTPSPDAGRVTGTGMDTPTAKTTIPTTRISTERDKPIIPGPRFGGYGAFAFLCIKRGPPAPASPGSIHEVFRNVA